MEDLCKYHMVNSNGYKAWFELADYLITEAGFVLIWAETDIKCRYAGISPSAVVIVATIRALKMHGGVKKTELAAENISALEKGFENLKKHIENIKKFGIPAVVAINKFSTDTDAEIAKLLELCRLEGVEASICDVWAKGGEGGEDLAQKVIDAWIKKATSNSI